MKYSCHISVGLLHMHLYRYKLFFVYAFGHHFAHSSQYQQQFIYLVLHMHLATFFVENVKLYVSSPDANCMLWLYDLLFKYNFKVNLR